MADAPSTPSEPSPMGSLMRDFMAHAVLFQEAVARSVGLNGSDLQVVGLLMSEGPASPTELATRIGFTTGGAITSLIDRLAKAGYVRREPDVRDRRRVLVVAETARVLHDVGSTYQRIGERWDQFLSTLTPEEVELCARVITAATQINREEAHRVSRQPRTPGASDPRS